MTDDTKRRLEAHNAYYDAFAAKVNSRTEKRDYSAHFEAFFRCVPKGATLLDIGCGTGLHLAYFQKQGYRAIGVEPSQGMRQEALSQGLNVVEGSFENLNRLDLPDIDGIWTAASLLHVPASELEQALNAMSHRLPKGGPLFLTVRTGSEAKWDSYDGTEVQRLIQLYEPRDLKRALLHAHFDVVYERLEQSTWGRPCEWVSMIAKAC